MKMTCEDCIETLKRIIGKLGWKLYAKDFEALYMAIDVLKKLEQQKFIELPCNVGDVVYLVSMQKITVDVVTRIKYVDRQNLIGRNRISIGGEKFSIYDNDFGRIAFLDKSKAEARLKELNEK